MLKQNPLNLICFLLIISALAFVADSVNAQDTATFEDPRDGRVYKTTQIGQQIWMAENLAYQTDIGYYWAYGDEGAHVDKYGYLYDWEGANHACPPGWRIPGVDDWRALAEYVGSNYSTKLKATSGWGQSEKGTDDFAFSVLPSGYRHANGEYYLKGEVGHFWSADETPHNQGLLGIKFGYAPGPNFPKETGFPVRCLKQ